ncbi:hypothetical protein G6F57_020560 [Rhizopus arrhizus]|nr:hypothetical protein G6F35_017816 [Rhizopus arrhizus]KAG1436669.1 hypothetical protein G6F57_020560 [Rhizopus arrhizus]
MRALQAGIVQAAADGDLCAAEQERAEKAAHVQVVHVWRGKEQHIIWRVLVPSGDGAHVVEILGLKARDDLGYAGRAARQLEHGDLERMMRNPRKPGARGRQRHRRNKLVDGRG